MTIQLCRIRYRIQGRVSNDPADRYGWNNAGTAALTAGDSPESRCARRGTAPKASRATGTTARLGARQPMTDRPGQVALRLIGHPARPRLSFQIAIPLHVSARTAYRPADLDRSAVLGDSTVRRAYASAAGALHQKEAEPAFGRNRSGFRTQPQLGGTMRPSPAPARDGRPASRPHSGPDLEGKPGRTRRGRLSADRADDVDAWRA